MNHFKTRLPSENSERGSPGVVNSETALNFDFSALIAELAAQPTAEDRFMEQTAQGEKLRREYGSLSDYEADMDDEALCEAHHTLNELIGRARKLLKAPIQQNSTTERASEKKGLYVVADQA